MGASVSSSLVLSLTALVSLVVVACDDSNDTFQAADENGSNEETDAPGEGSPNDIDSPELDGRGGDSGDSSDAEIYVDAHNEVRASVTEPEGYAGSWEPLPAVTWSDEIAASAQEWADHLQRENECGLQHDNSSSHGENLAGGWDLSPTRAVELWASEAKDYTYEASYQFVAGHYTQIVWRTSTTIGCASASCGQNSVVVCRYSAPGNMIGGSIF